MKDVDLKNGVLCIRQSKFEKSRYVPMDLNLTERCKKYVQLIRNNATAEDFFLPSQMCIRDRYFSQPHVAGRPGTE